MTQPILMTQAIENKDSPSGWVRHTVRLFDTLVIIIVKSANQYDPTRKETTMRTGAKIIVVGLYVLCLICLVGGPCVVYEERLSLTAPQSQWLVVIAILSLVGAIAIQHTAHYLAIKRASNK